MPATHGGLDGHSVTRLETRDARADEGHFPGRLMPEDLWIRGRIAVDIAIRIPMHVASADPDRAYLYQNLLGARILRERRFDHFESARRYQLNGFQSTTLAEITRMRALSEPSMALVLPTTTFLPSGTSTSVAILASTLVTPVDVATGTLILKLTRSNLATLALSLPSMLTRRY